MTSARRCNPLLASRRRARVLRFPAEQRSATHVVAEQSREVTSHLVGIGAHEFGTHAFRSVGRDHHAAQRHRLAVHVSVGPRRNRAARAELFEERALSDDGFERSFVVDAAQDLTDVVVVNARFKAEGALADLGYEPRRIESFADELDALEPFDRGHRGDDRVDAILSRRLETFRHIAAKPYDAKVRSAFEQQSPTTW